MACETCFIYDFIVRLAGYFVTLALLLIITFMVFKFIGEWRERQALEEIEGENSPIMVNKTINISYGACLQDLESQTCNTNTSSNGSSNGKCSALYDSKICIICYDAQRNCFFVPCGHCATCFLCAQRIFYEEKRNCPVCRRLIGKITTWFNS